MIGLTLYHTIPSFDNALENIVGKGEKAGKHHFLLFARYTVFLPVICEITILATLYLSSANAFNLVLLNFCRLLKI